MNICSRRGAFWIRLDLPELLLLLCYVYDTILIVLSYSPRVARFKHPASHSLRNSGSAPASSGSALLPCPVGHAEVVRISDLILEIYAIDMMDFMLLSRFCGICDSSSISIGCWRLPRLSLEVIMNASLHRAWWMDRFISYARSA